MTYLNDATAAYPLHVGITLAATPIGNLGDASPRLCTAIAQADVIAAEDTRKTRQLAQSLGIEIQGRVLSNFEHNEQERVATLIELARHQRVLVVSDAGMPVISDPGFPLVKAARVAGVALTCIPGASAVTTALAISGLAGDRFAFDGFVPRKAQARKAWLGELSSEPRAVCAFESPHRVVQTLNDAREVLGEQREVAVARELTKKFEEVFVGTLAQACTWAADGVRGEIVLVFSPATPKKLNAANALPEVQALVDSGVRTKDACKQIAAKYDLSAKELYAGMLEAR
ncbi:MAG: 16S rRNA (cytidine(1402)-2'-O)-methyltransferase [Corynebacterium sp.]|nr:16S rRNA (cytidine(1402)-2'-O)-methyltransferase [Corynebacterium sp.]